MIDTYSKISRPYSLSLEAVHNPRQYRSYGRGRSNNDGGFPRAGFFRDPGYDTSDIPGFDDFFSKIEQAVDSEISDSPYQVIQNAHYEILCTEDIFKGITNHVILFEFQFDFLIPERSLAVSGA